MGWKLIAAIVGMVVIVSVYRRVTVVMGHDVVHAPSLAADSDKGTPLQYTLKDIDGKDVNLADYKGKVVMIVNVASKCGFTKQYEGLEKLYMDYKDKGFVILGFPANNFGGQEPGTDEEIKTFCSSKYSVTFPMFHKLSVAGADQAPLYKFLTEKDTAGEFAGKIGWNFTKFLVDKNGHLYARFASPTKPSDKELVDAVEKGIAH